MTNRSPGCFADSTHAKSAFPEKRNGVQPLFIAGHTRDCGVSERKEAGQWDESCFIILHAVKHASARVRRWN